MLLCIQKRGKCSFLNTLHPHINIKMIFQSEEKEEREGKLFMNKNQLELKTTIGTKNLSHLS